MKIPRPVPRGSMGIPAELSPERVFAKPAEPEAPDEPEGEEEKAEIEPNMETPEDEENAAAAEAAKAAHPVEMLKRLGVELNDEDFNKLLFKGHIEKPIKLCFDPLTKKPFTATFRTLTAQEYDEVDELLADEQERLKMTVAGRDARRSTWLLSFAMTHINGMALQKPVVNDGVLDTKKTAQARVKVVRALSPFILDKASRVYAAFTTAVSLMVEDPDKNFIKKP